MQKAIEELKRCLANSLKQFSFDDIQKIEVSDLQYRALFDLWNKGQLSAFSSSSCELFTRLVVANALVSYQPSGKGELYWEEFSTFFSTRRYADVYEAISNFLRESHHNRRLHNVKLGRLRKALPSINEIRLDTTYSELYKALLSAFHAPYSKTASFAVKMFGYARRVITAEFVMFPFSIPIPLDSRIKCLTPLSSAQPRKTFPIKQAIGFWQDVAQLANLPALHIDSVLWNIDRLKHLPLDGALRSKLLRLDETLNAIGKATQK